MNLFSKQTASISDRSSRPAIFEPLESRSMMSASPLHAAGPHAVNAKGAVYAHLAAVKSSAPITGQTTTFIRTSINYGPIKYVIHPFPLFIEPKADSNVTSWKDYSMNPLFGPGGPSASDVYQGAVGDCWFVATLSEVALRDPNAIRHDITQRSDGTYDVYFHNGSKIVDEHVDGLLPVNKWGGLEYAQLGQGGSTWVAIMEKALTYFRNASHGAAYSNNAFGWGSEALADLGATGINEILSKVTTSTQLFDDVVWGLIFGTDMQLGTNGNSGPLVNSHEYAIVSAGWSASTGNEIELRNPWGTTGPGGDGYEWFSASSILPQLSELVFASV